MPTKIKYNGTEIASITGGQTATIKCADKAMNGDIEITTDSTGQGIVNVTIKEI